MSKQTTNPPGETTPNDDAPSSSVFNEVFSMPRNVTRANGQRLSLLLIEDAASDVALAEELLQDSMPDYQWHVIDRPSLAQALALLEQMKFDMILLDLDLRDASGLETVVALRRAAPHLPIVIYSGTPDQFLLADAMANGARFCIQKGRTAPSVVRTILRSALTPLNTQDALGG